MSQTQNQNRMIANLNYKHAKVPIAKTKDNTLRSAINSEGITITVDLSSTKDGRQTKEQLKKLEEELIKAVMHK